jgi:hypothetical protein
MHGTSVDIPLSGRFDFTAGYIVMMLLVFMPVICMGFSLGRHFSVQKFIFATDGTKIIHLPILLNLMRSAFPHNHSTYRVFNHILSFLLNLIV